MEVFALHQIKLWGKHWGLGGLGSGGLGRGGWRASPPRTKGGFGGTPLPPRATLDTICMLQIHVLVQIVEFLKKRKTMGGPHAMIICVPYMIIYEPNMDIY